VLLLHISNNHLDLKPLIRRLADDHSPALVVRYCHDKPTDAEGADGKSESQWMVLARTEADLAGLGLGAPLPAGTKRQVWERVEWRDGPLWRDDFANLLRVWKKNEE
jgi:hypothetical protein